MQAILNFLYRFRATFLFFSLQVVCLLLIARYNNYQGAFLFNTSSFYVGKLNQWSNETLDYLSLREVNKKLADENARLHELLLKERQKNYTHLQPVGNTSIANKYRFEPAKVVNKTTRKLRNFITIEKGLENGVEKDMGVISAEGIVGRVVEVSPHYAVVSTILHNQSTTPVHVKLQKMNENYLSHIQWDGKDPNFTKLKDIPLSIPVSIGDTVTTTGYNAFFPADVMVGVVARINPQKTSTFHDIDVRLSTNFNTLGYVYVVKNKLQSEQLQIEKDTNKMKKAPKVNR
jgi:rod shape-determining protein MreC